MFWNIAVQGHGRDNSREEPGVLSTQTQHCTIHSWSWLPGQKQKAHFAGLQTNKKSSEPMVAHLCGRHQIGHWNVGDRTVILLD